jgi:hypothetical protein
LVDVDRAPILHLSTQGDRFKERVKSWVIIKRYLMTSEEEMLEIRRREAIINAALRELLTTGCISGEDPDLTSRESYPVNAASSESIESR